MHNINIKHRHGSALVLIIVCMVVLMLTGVGLLAVGYNSRVVSLRDAQTIAARCAADAGMSRAVYLVNKQLRALSLDDASLPAEANTMNPMASNESYTCSVAGSWPAYTITSTGTCGNIQRTVYGSLVASGIFDDAILVSDSIKMGNGDVISGSNPNLEVKIGTLSTVAGKVALGGTEVNGNVFCGYGGDPATVITGGTITDGGIKYALDEPKTLSPVPIPAAAVAASPKTGTSTDWTLSSGTLGAVGTQTYFRYDSIDLQGNGANLQINGDVTLYVTDDINMDKNGAGITVNANSKLTVYVGGDMTGQNGVGLNNTTADPSNLKIYGVGTGTQTITLKNNSTTFGVIYAPNAAVDIKNNGDMTGSVVARSFEMKNNGDFIYDQAVRSAYAKTDPGVLLVLQNWHE